MTPPAHSSSGETPDAQTPDSPPTPGAAFGLSPQEQVAPAADTLPANTSTPTQPAAKRPINKWALFVIGIFTGAVVIGGIWATTALWKTPEKQLAAAAADCGILGKDGITVRKTQILFEEDSSGETDSLSARCVINELGFEDYDGDPFIAASISREEESAQWGHWILFVDYDGIDGETIDLRVND